MHRSRKNYHLQEEKAKAHAASAVPLAPRLSRHRDSRRCCKGGRGAPRCSMGAPWAARRSSIAGRSTMKGRHRISLRRSSRPARDLIAPYLEAALLLRHQLPEVRTVLPEVRMGPHPRACLRLRPPLSSPAAMASTHRLVPAKLAHRRSLPSGESLSARISDDPTPPSAAHKCSSYILPPSQNKCISGTSRSQTL
jgi:hypothetical protein